ncbi:hypothetical protein [Planktotalea sp.]|uniref:hypothetical protein n=1 Tax=Planktotalea sp. TaxID=2029877 RepID=UPI003D6A4808
MGKKAEVQQPQALAFSHRLRSEHYVVPNPRDVLGAEETLGTGAIGFQLSGKGRRTLFRALHMERKSKLRSAQG